MARCLSAVPFFLVPSCLVKVKRSFYRFSEMEGRCKKDTSHDGSVSTGNDVMAGKKRIVYVYIYVHGKNKTKLRSPSHSQLA